MRVELMSAYVLHTRPYRNTSLLVDAFTVDQGRMTGVAKGAHRERSSLRDVMHLFTPLALSWVGASDLKTLTAAQTSGVTRWLQGRALMSGLYVNELLMKLISVGDAHEALFWRYDRVLTELASGCDAAVSLRLFEKTLMAELGFGLCFERDAGSNLLEPEALYCFDPDCGVRRVASHVTTADEAVLEQAVRGETLLALRCEALAGARVLREARRFLGSMIQHCLGGVTLQSPLIWRRRAPVRR